MPFSNVLEKMKIDPLNRDLGKYEIYEPLLSGLKLTKRLAPWITVVMIYRRIILVLVALFLYNYAWIQVTSFVLCSLFVACMIVYSYPYVDKGTNRLEVFNEFMITCVGYLAMVYVGVSISPPQDELCGTFMLLIIRIHIGVNVIIIVKD